MLQIHKRHILNSLTLLAFLSAAPAHADEKAKELLKAVEKATRAARTLTADLQITQEIGPRNLQLQGKVRLKKPNLAYIQFGDAKQKQTIASDGKNLFMLLPDNQYLKREADKGGAGISLLPVDPISLFFATNLTKRLFPFGGSPQPTYIGKQTIGGQALETIELQGDPAKEQPTVRLYVNRDRLVSRVQMEMDQGGQKVKIVSALRNIRLNPALTTASFAYQPPRDARPFTQPQIDDYDKKLVAVGKYVPKFSMPTLTQERVTIEDLGKEKKAILVNFWFYG